jgi:hypothetical protein
LQDGGHFSLSLGLHPARRVALGKQLRMRTKFGRI